MVDVMLRETTTTTTTETKTGLTENGRNRKVEQVTKHTLLHIDCERIVFG